MFLLFTDKDQAQLDAATTDSGEDNEGAIGGVQGSVTQADVYQEQDKD